jgi:hypothetical protein
MSDIGLHITVLDEVNVLCTNIMNLHCVQPICLRVLLKSANCCKHYFGIRLDKMIDYKCLLYMST